MATPSLMIIEKEVELKVAATEFNSDSDLQQLHETGMNLLNNEKKERNEMQNNLNDLDQKMQIELEKLDKKRKFLDELPNRISLLKDSTTDLQNQFSTAVGEI